MVDLTELAERVEGLAGPDREVDSEIYRWTEWTGDPEDWPFITGADSCPRYTASLDAAMTLVPEGHRWRCGYSRHVPHNAEVVDYINHKGTYIGESDHSRALALTAAALRARARLQEAAHD